MHHDDLEQYMLRLEPFVKSTALTVVTECELIFQRLFYLLTLLASLKCWEAKEIGRQSTSQLPTARAKIRPTMSFHASTFLPYFDFTKIGDGANYQMHI